MSAIGVGDWVECINLEATGLRFGGVYRVLACGSGGGHCWDCGSHGWADVCGDTAPESDFSWCIGCELRPIYHPKAEIIEALKAPSPEMEDAL